MPNYPMAGPAFAVLLGLLTLAASGGGRLLARPSAHGLRQTAADCVLGLLAYVVVFGLLAEIGAPAWLVTIVLIGFGLLGTASLVRDRAEIKHRTAAFGIVTVAALVTGLTPVNVAAVDPWNYAYLVATLFREDWVRVNLSAVPDVTWLADLTHLGMLTRAPPLALVWPATVLGLSLDARTIASLGALLLIGACALMTDLLAGPAPLAVRVLLSVGALGAFNATALLTGGQLNQPFALAISIGMLWLVRHLEADRSKLLSVALAGAALAGGYPEFLAAAPLYLLCLFVLVPPRSTWLAVVAFAAGVLLVEVASRFAGVEYLTTQARLNPQWWPLPNDPANALDEWLAILLQRLPPRLSLVLVVPALWLGWRVCRPADGPPRRVLVPALIGLACVIVAPTLLLGRSANVNYATFKLAGWLGPGLFVLAWRARPAQPVWLARGFATLLLGLATFRALGLAAEVYTVGPLYAEPVLTPPGWYVETAALTRRLVLTSTDRSVVEAAVAGSAAPARGDAVRVPQ